MPAIVEVLATCQKGIDSILDKVCRTIDHNTLGRNTRYCNLVRVDSCRAGWTLSCCIDDRDVCIDRRRSTRKSCYRNRIVDTCNVVDCSRYVVVGIVARRFVLVVVVLEMVLETNVRLVSMFGFDVGWRPR